MPVTIESRFLNRQTLLVLSLTAGLGALSACGSPEPASEPPHEVSAVDHSLVDDYLETYFQTFPTRATSAGRHDLDNRLEDLGPEARLAWLDFSKSTRSQVEAALRDESLDFELRLDLELLLRQVERQIMDYEALKVPRRNPLFWTGILGNATVFLLVRDDLPLEERLGSAAARAELIPRLVAQAQDALADSAVSMAPEHCRLAARQAKGTALFYRSGFPEAAGDNEEIRAALAESGGQAATALEELGEFLDRLCEQAQGSPRLEHNYARRFRVVTGIEKAVDQVLAGAEAALIDKRAETAEYGRSIWAEIFPGEEAPADDVELVARLFARIGEDGAESIEEYVVDFKSLIDESVDFVRERDLVTLPEPLTLHTDRSPSFFVGASVGGVYPAGPYAPQDAKTLLFVPTPPDSATPEQKRAFFRDFNHNFNVMIVPHEIIPGHYLQLKYAAAHPHKLRAMFGDGVYIEGWGTFCERLMLDEGWGEPLARLAHLKKQLENIARTIVDIRVHTQGMTSKEVVRFVQEEALQDAQFASNMWRRAITSSPQLTSYYLGYAQVQSLFADVRAARGDEFRVKDFMDGMMEMGPVPVRHYRERMLGSGSEAVAH